MSEQTLALVAAIKSRLDAAVRRIALANLLSGVALAAGILALAWLILSAAEARFWFGVPVRSVLAILLAVLVLALAARHIVLPLLSFRGIFRPLRPHDVAARVGERYPDVSDRLLNLMELVEGQRSRAPSPLVDGAARMLAEQIREVPFEQVEDFRSVHSRARWAAIPFALLILFAVAAPGSFLHASQRLLLPAREFQRPGPFELILSPGSPVLVRGQAFDVTVLARGRQLPARITLAVQVDGEKRADEYELQRDSSGAFRYRLRDVRESFRFRASAGPVVSIWHRATVVQRPIVRGLQLTLNYPSYTGMDPSRLEPNSGDVTALTGTQVNVDVAISGSGIEQAFLRFDDNSTQKLDLQGDRASGTFPVRKTGTYSIVLRRNDGIENSDRISYRINALADGSPTIIQYEPSGDTDLNESSQVDLHARINDDFGFSALRLFFRLAERAGHAMEGDFASIPLSISSARELDQEVLRKWILTEDSGLRPETGDVYEYFLQVWDNDRVSGFKSARTPVSRLRVPSLEQHFEALKDEQDAAEQVLEDLTLEARELQSAFKELQDELRRDPEATWEDKRQLQSLQDQQQALEKQLDDLSTRIEDVTERMKDNGLVSEETIAAYKELQRVVEEMRSPELAEALRKLQEAMESLNLQQMQESMNEFKFNEQQYQQRLERTVELFKRMRMQQGLDEAARRAADLLRREEEIQQQTEALEKAAQDKQKYQENQKNAERLAGEQDQARQEMESLQQRVEELQKQAQDMKRGPKQQMEQLSEQMRKDQTAQQMKQNSEQLREQEFQKAEQGQEQIQEQLNQMQNSLQQMEQQMQQGGKQANMAGLRRALQNVLTLSKEQEQLRNDLRRLKSDAPQLRPYAQRQMDVAEDFGRVSDSLRALARQIPQMTRDVQQQSASALREMSSATTKMSEGIIAETATHQKSAMTHLNELALLLSDLMSQMMSSSGSGSGGMSMEQMLQQMQQMSGDQQKLNDEIQQMLNDRQGNRLSVDMQQRMRQLSQAQEEVRKQLKQLSRDPNAKNNLSGDMNKVGEDMEETVQELQRGQVDRQMIERQRQILTRMLEAQRSLQQQGEQEERESRTGRNNARPVTGSGTPEEQTEKLRRDLLRALDSGYAPDYEDLIKRYFEILQQQRTQPGSGQ